MNSSKAPQTLEDYQAAILLYWNDICCNTMPQENIKFIKMIGESYIDQRDFLYDDLQQDKYSYSYLASGQLSDAGCRMRGWGLALKNAHRQAHQST